MKPRDDVRNMQYNCLDPGLPMFSRLSPCKCSPVRRVIVIDLTFFIKLLLAVADTAEYDFNKACFMYTIFCHRVTVLQKCVRTALKYIDGTRFENP